MTANLDQMEVNKTGSVSAGIDSPNMAGLVFGVALRVSEKDFQQMNHHARRSDRLVSYLT
jgi:hypothetical protein